MRAGHGRAATETARMNRIDKRYVDTSSGQVHVYHCPGTAGRPLLCLHPAPYSGFYFKTFMPLIDRDVYAPDYPGYGGSSAAAETPDIGYYARVMLECIDALPLEPPVDVLGFHTGCLVAVEMALEAPGHMGRLVLCNIPFFDAETQSRLSTRLNHQVTLSESLDCLQTSWDLAVRRLADGMGLERAFANYVEHLRSVPTDDQAFDAAFAYDCESRFRELDADVTVIVTDSILREATLDAAMSIRNAELVEADDVRAGVFESGAERMAEYLDHILDRAV